MLKRLSISGRRGSISRVAPLSPDETNSGRRDSGASAVDISGLDGAASAGSPSSAAALARRRSSFMGWGGATAAAARAASLPVWTAKEVATRNGAHPTICYVIIEGHVVDLTTYKEHHPGGGAWGGEERVRWRPVPATPLLSPPPRPPPSSPPPSPARSATHPGLRGPRHHALLLARRAPLCGCGRGVGAGDGGAGRLDALGILLSSLPASPAAGASEDDLDVLHFHTRMAYDLTVKNRVAILAKPEDATGRLARAAEEGTATAASAAAPTATGADAAGEASTTVLAAAADPEHEAVGLTVGGSGVQYRKLPPLGAAAAAAAAPAHKQQLKVPLLRCVDVIPEDAAGTVKTCASGRGGADI